MSNYLNDKFKAILENREFEPLSNQIEINKLFTKRVIDFLESRKLKYYFNEDILTLEEGQSEIYQTVKFVESLEDDDINADTDDSTDTDNSDDESEDDVDIISEGDRVLYNGKIMTVKESKGPKDTIGIEDEDNFEMADKSDVKKLDEQIIGFSPMSDLSRIRHLAGIKEDFIGDEIDTGEDLAPNVPAMQTSIISDDDVEDDMHPLDLISDVDHVDLYPNDEESDSLEDDSTGLDLIANEGPSEAYIEISTSIETIKSVIGDLKVSEYKDLSNALKDLADTARNSGRNFLGESKK